ncbi:MAG: class I SAM-dependent methyltransferase [Bacteroidetes bacterium]|nr:class I SAM-dependent methyltransferase [Bacteroidota bacterium]
MKDVREFYNHKYSGFEGLPGYSVEKNKIDSWMSLLSSEKLLNLSDLNSQTCIDLGCGFGLKTFALSLYFKFTLGVDFSSKAIEVASLLNSLPEKLNFTCSEAGSVNSKYNFISAIGFSDFNVKDISLQCDRITKICTQLLLPTGFLMIASFTDFSGASPTGWHLHTRKELKNLIALIKRNDFMARIIFPSNSFHAFQKSDGQGKLDLLKQTFALKPKIYLMIIQSHG